MTRMLCLSLAGLLPTQTALAGLPEGSIIGWGSQVVGVDLDRGFVAIGPGGSHSLGLKVNGSIVAPSSKTLSPAAQSTKS